MFFLPLLAAASLVSAQSTLPIGIDPRCKRMDSAQWEGFAKKEVIRQRAFAGLGLPKDRPYTEVLFSNESQPELNDNWFCAEGWNTVFEPAKKLSCNVQNVNLIDKSNNAPGVVTINVQSGTTSSTTLTETDSSATAAGVSLKMSGKIPLVGGVETTISFTETYTKTFSKAQTVTTNTLTSISRAINIGGANSNCKATLAMTTCQHETNGKYPIIALGWVGWRLKDEYTFKGEKARRWYVFIDNFPRADREDFGTLNAGIGSETYATVVSQCDVATTKALSQTTRRFPRSDRAIRLREDVPAHADELQSSQSKMARATIGLSEHLKRKVITVGDTLFLAVPDDE